ncbi:MAG: dihydropyrimidine dehydrogenase, partial [Spirochaetaceae bacterium]|nr:dihydropyrimidine dehydrogenase [Spirochaetaceae bacterium]
MGDHITREALDAQAKTLLAEIRAKEKAGTLSAKDRLAIPPQEMPLREPRERRRVMDEVALGYTEAQAITEASR